MWSHHENGSCTPCWQEKLWFSSFIQVFEHRKIIKSIFNRDNINNGYTMWFMVIIGKWISVSLAADLIHIYCMYTSWEKLWKYLIFNEINDRSVICRLNVMHIYTYIVQCFCKFGYVFIPKTARDHATHSFFIKWSELITSIWNDVCLQIT